MLSKKIFIFLLFATIGCNSITHFLNKPPPQQVVKFTGSHVTILYSQGDVNYWPPFGTRWKHLYTNANIPLGSLVQMDSGSELKIQFILATNHGWRGRSVNINVRIPICMRVEEDLLRDIKFTEQYISKISDFTLAKGVDNLTSFDFSWQRMIAFLTQNESMKNSMASLLQIPKESFEVGMVFGEIKLRNPSHGYTLYSQEFPTSMNVSWDRIHEPNATYKVFVWRTDEKKGSALGSTKDNYYQVSFPKMGSYYVQVAEVGKEFISKPHLVHLVSPGSMQMTLTDRLKINNAIKLIYPQEYGLFFLNKPTDKVKFSWQVSPKNDIGSLKFFLIKVDSERFEAKGFLEKSRNMVGENFQQSYDINRNSSFLEIELEPGRYEWWMEGLVDSNVTRKKIVEVKSDKRIFELEHANLKAPIDFKNIISTREFKTVYINSF